MSEDEKPKQYLEVYLDMKTQRPGDWGGGSRRCHQCAVTVDADDPRLQELLSHFRTVCQHLRAIEVSDAVPADTR